MPARLTLHFPSAPARELVLPEGRETVVGRGAECGLVVDDDRVSRRHAALSPAASGWTVADLGSKNGTLVDGVPVAAGRPAPLSPAAPSWISFGGVVARFETLSGPVEALPEARLRRLTSALLTSAPEIRRDLDPTVGLRELLSRVVASMLALANAERGFLLLAGTDGSLEVAARSGLSWDDLRAAEFGGSVGAVQRTLASGRAVVSTDVRADAELGARASIVGSGIRALLCVPVQALDRRIGVLYADSRRPGAAFTELDVELLEALAGQAGLAIAVARLDGELRGLAERLAVAGKGAGEGAEEGARALGPRLSGEITAILDRALKDARLPEARPAASVASIAGVGGIAGIAGPPTRALADTWHGLVAAHAALGTPA
jgi:putative methionine-R-sulfoxide reductase with GAF domain